MQDEKIKLPGYKIQAFKSDTPRYTVSHSCFGDVIKKKKNTRSIR